MSSQPAECRVRALGSQQVLYFLEVSPELQSWAYKAGLDMLRAP